MDWIALNRSSLKCFLTNPDALDLPAVVPVFHRWIQDKAIPDVVLIDVHDYKHVAGGPGILLVGHECDFAVDTKPPGTGLLYRQKRGEFGDLATRLRDALRGCLRGCQILQQEEALRGRVNFEASTLEISLDDRLRAPNTPETFAAVKPELERILGEVFPAADIGLEPAGEPRQMFKVHISLTPAPAIDEVLQRLDQQPLQAG